MKKKIDTCTTNLIQVIQNSREYRQFQEISSKVNAEPELRERINTFRKLVYDVQNSNEPLDMYAEQERLCREYEEFRKNPLVDEFLKAELRVCRVVQYVMERIATEIDLDTKEIAEQIEI